MKLLPVKKRKIAILFTGGLGDTLLYTPLLKELKKKQFTVTCIFYSPYENDCLFDKSLYTHKVKIKSKTGLLIFALSRVKYFINFYINHLGSGAAVNLAAAICSKHVTKNKCVPDFSDGEENLHLVFSTLNSRINTIESYYFPNPEINQQLIQKYFHNNTTEYFIIQISAGNNTTPFKNWPLQNWVNLITQLCIVFPMINFIIVGDAAEVAYTKIFRELNYANCIVLIGKTSVREVFNLTAFSNGYIGLDSGIMHMAVGLQKKTLTIFGGSNESLYGYQILDGKNHKVISSSLKCRPCSGWKNANTSRVSNPLDCPDFACLTTIEPSFVYQQLTNHFNL